MKSDVLKRAMSAVICLAVLICSVGVSAYETYISNDDLVTTYQTVETLYKNGTEGTTVEAKDATSCTTTDGVITATLNGGTTSGIQISKNGFTFVQPDGDGDYLCFDVKFDEGIEKEMFVRFGGYFANSSDAFTPTEMHNLDVATYGTLNSDGYYAFRCPLNEFRDNMDKSKNVGTVWIRLQADGQPSTTNGKKMYIKNIEVKTATTGVAKDTTADNVPTYTLYEEGLERGVTASGVSGSTVSTEENALKATVAESGDGVELDTTGRTQIFDSGDQAGVYINADVKVSGVSGLVNVALVYTAEGEEEKVITYPINIVNDGTALGDDIYRIAVPVSSFEEDDNYKWPQYSKIRFLSGSTDVESGAYICVNNVVIGTRKSPATTNVIWNAYDDGLLLTGSGDAVHMKNTSTGSAITPETDGTLKVTISGNSGISILGQKEGNAENRMGLTVDNIEDAYLCFSVKYDGDVPEAMRAVLWKDTYNESSDASKSYYQVGAWNYPISNTTKWQDIRVPLRDYRNGCGESQLKWIRGVKLEPAGDGGSYTMSIDNVRVETVSEKVFRADLSIQNSALTGEVSSMTAGDTVNAVVSYNNRLEGKAVSFTLVVGVYEGKVLKNAYVLPKTVEVGAKGKHKQELTAGAGQTIKAMLWDNMGNLTPLTDFVDATAPATE